MARLVLLRFLNDGSLDSEAVSINGAGAGFLLIWRILHQKYIGGTEEEAAIQLMTGFRPLFKAFNDGKMTRRDGVLMMSTCDRVVIMQGDELREVAAAWRSFFEEHVKGVYRETIGHAAEELELLCEREDVLAVALWNTNIGNPWVTGQDEDGEDVYYNILEGEDHSTILSGSV